MSWELLKLVYGSIPSFIKALLKHPRAFIRASREAKRRAQELMPAKTALPYEIPVYQEGMPYCKSDEPYLKPTYLCESDAPEIIAVANKLGSFQKSDREYVQACFDFVKKNIEFTFFQPVLGAVGTLRSGRGICLDNVGLFIALCRAGGIPARYRIYNEALVTSAYEVLTADDPVLRDWYNSMGHFIMHASAEALYDGQWVVGEFLLTPELEAGLGLPLSRLGDDASGAWCYRLRDAIVRLDSIPPSIAKGMSLAIKFMGGLFMGVELRLQERIRQGRRILEEMGEEEYSRKLKQTYKAVLPEVSMKLSRALEMAEER